MYKLSEERQVERDANVRWLPPCWQDPEFSEEELNDMQLGTVIKVRFELPDDRPVRYERIWLELTCKREGAWLGTLRNHPLHLPHTLGDTVRFAPRQVVDVWLEW